MEISRSRSPYSAAMRAIARPFFFVLLLISLSFTSCSDSTSPPDGSGGDGYSSTFAIKEAITDTLYIDEYAWIKATGAGNNIAALKLFVHTHQCVIDSITGDKIHFRMPDQAETGKVRLYKHDALLATGDFVISAIPRRIESFTPVYIGIDALDGFVGDFIGIFCNRAPMRRKDFSLSVDGVEFEIVSFTRDRVITRVPKNAKSGPMTFRMIDRTWSPGNFTLHKGGERLLKEETVSRVQVRAWGLTVNWDLATISGSDTTHRREPGKYGSYWETHSWSATASRLGDSVIVNAVRNEASFHTLVIRLKVNEKENRASGTVHYVLESNTRKDSSFVEIENLRYVDNDGSYEFRLYGEDIAKHVKTFSTVMSAPEGYTAMWDYEGLAEDASFSMIIAK